MRVIAGKAKGIQLNTPEGMLTRPTTDRVKEALFSIIQFELPGARVLDLFGGTGQLGIEALSRGASNAVFVDSRREACQLIRSNLKTIHFIHYTIPRTKHYYWSDFYFFDSSAYFKSIH